MAATVSSVINKTMTANTKGETKRRVKLYVLNEQRSWDDKGTGHVSCGTFDGAGGGITLVVRSEEGVTASTILLESKIHMDTAYQKQQETLIVWSEGENCDLALSFQEKAGCDEIWERICEVQGKDPSVEVTQDVSYEGESDDNEGEANTSAMTTGGGVLLPSCELSKLGDILEFITSCMHSPQKRESLVVALEQEKYISKLLELFRMCEDLESTESLHLLYRIIKQIFLLNKNALFEVLFSDEHLKEVVGVLEYDPTDFERRKIVVTKDSSEDSSPTKTDLSARRKHREYLWNKASFKEVIPFGNAELKSKIHQTYRVQYIQEVILPAPSIFEENQLSSLASFIFFNKVEIVSLIQDDNEFLLRLFDELADNETEVMRRRDLTLFLKEFCSFSQTLQPQARDNFFKATTGDQGRDVRKKNEFINDEVEVSSDHMVSEDETVNAGDIGSDLGGFIVPDNESDNRSKIGSTRLIGGPLNFSNLKIPNESEKVGAGRLMRLGRMGTGTRKAGWVGRHPLSFQLNFPSLAANLPSLLHNRSNSNPSSPTPSGERCGGDNTTPCGLADREMITKKKLCNYRAIGRNWSPRTNLNAASVLRQGSFSNLNPYASPPPISPKAAQDLFSPNFSLSIEVINDGESDSSSDSEEELQEIKKETTEEDEKTNMLEKCSNGVTTKSPLNQSNETAGNTVEVNNVKEEKGVEKCLVGPASDKTKSVKQVSAEIKHTIGDNPPMPNSVKQKVVRSKSENHPKKRRKRTLRRRSTSRDGRKKFKTPVKEKSLKANNKGLFEYALHKTLTHHGILSSVEKCMRSPDEMTRLAAIEVFAMVVDFSPSMVREYILVQNKDVNLSDDDLLMNILIRQMFSDSDPDLSSAMQILNIIRILVDPENMMGNATVRTSVYSNKSEKSDFLTLFYRRCMFHLCKPLIENTTNKRPLKDDYHTATKLNAILELLTFCIEHHSYNIRNFVISKELMKKVAILLRSKHTFLALGALRFIRKVIQLKEEYYNRHIIKHNIFEDIVRCYVNNGSQYNLLNSALLELFEFIKSEDIKSLTAHIVEKYMDQFETVDYVKTFQNLKLRYEQNMERIKYKQDCGVTGSPLLSKENGRGGVTPPVNQGNWRGGFKDPDAEEDWFHEEEEEEWDDDLPTSPGSNVNRMPLVTVTTSSTTPNNSPDKAQENSPPTSHDNLPTLQRVSGGFGHAKDPKSSELFETSSSPPQRMSNALFKLVEEGDVPNVFSPGGTRPPMLARTLHGGGGGKITIKPPSPSTLSLLSSGKKSPVPPTVPDKVSSSTGAGQDSPKDTPSAEVVNTKLPLLIRDDTPPMEEVLAEEERERVRLLASPPSHDKKPSSQDSSTPPLKENILRRGLVDYDFGDSDSEDEPEDSSVPSSESSTLPDNPSSSDAPNAPTDESGLSLRVGGEKRKKEEILPSPTSDTPIPPDPEIRKEPPTPIPALPDPATEEIPSCGSPERKRLKMSEEPETESRNEGQKRD